MSDQIESSTSTVVGVVLITRHGDRLGYFQSPTTYSASGTTITPLGSRQTYQSGIQLRERYLTNTSSNAIQGLDWPLVNLAEVNFIADAAEGQVIVDSAYSFAQGLFPNSTIAGSQLLANSSTVTSPLGGYIYVPITTVEPAEEITLEGFTSCPTFTSRNTAIYNTTAFKAVATQQQAYLASLPPYLDGRNVSLSNMYNIFDYMNVQNIHNKTFADLVSANGTSNYIMENSRYLANYHEQAVFTDSDIDGIGNIAGQTIIPPILSALKSFADPTQTLKLQYIGVAYKPFLSLFNMTQVGIDGMVDYASVLALEVRNNSNAYTVTFNFRNGSADVLGVNNPLTAYPLFGQNQTEIPLQTFIDNLEPHGISDLATWCSRCNNTNSRGCDLISELQNATTGLTESAEYASITSTTGKQHVSPVVAGLIGAVVGILLAALVFGGLGFLDGKRRKAQARLALT